MKIIGVIVEYNPLHNGHIHHINKIKELANADLIVAVLSGSFTMRGDLSLFDKFTKAKQALENSIDVIIELPAALAMHKADIFAKNAVLFLNMLNVNEIWIGSEQNDPSIYEKCYNQLKGKDEYIKGKLKEGLSYKEITNELFPLLSNDLLGYSYYKAIKDNKLNIELKTIKRINSNYLDTTPTSPNITSALSIRNDLSILEEYTPKFVYEDRKTILDENKLFNLLKYKILSSSPAELKEIFFVDEGLENKLNEIKAYNSLNDFIKHLTTKRYTSTRIKRMLMYILLNITKAEMNNILNTNIDYVRILGYSIKGKEYISSIKKSINIYTNIKEGINKILDLELKISKILDSIYNLNLLYKEQKAPLIKN